MYQNLEHQVKEMQRLHSGASRGDIQVSGQGFMSNAQEVAPESGEINILVNEWEILNEQLYFVVNSLSERTVTIRDLSPYPQNPNNQKELEPQPQVTALGARLRANLDVLETRIKELREITRQIQL